MTAEDSTGVDVEDNFWEVEMKDVNLYEAIGEGTFSKVYRGSWRGADVAVKEIHLDLPETEEMLKMFKRELTVMLTLRHPNLVLLLGAHTRSKPLRILVEYCSGGSLYDLLHVKREVQLSWGQRAVMMLDVAKGIYFMHSSRPPVIHRDIKSLNLLLEQPVYDEEDPIRVKIADFGMARLEQQATAGLTEAAGTFHWMAPEVLRGEDYDERCDIYSFGITLTRSDEPQTYLTSFNLRYEIISRELPYRDAEMSGMAVAIAVTRGLRPEDAYIPTDAPDAAVALMKKCWAGEAAARPTQKQISSDIGIFTEHGKPGWKNVPAHVTFGKRIRVDDLYGELLIEWRPEDIYAYDVEGDTTIRIFTSMKLRGSLSEFPFVSGVAKWEEILTDWTTPQYGREKELLVVINPIGGRKRAKKMFREILQPMLDRAHRKYSVVQTDHPGHAGEIARSIDLEKIGAIAAVGGDGLVYELVNGMAERPDASEAFAILGIGQLPAGSHNSLAASGGMRQPLTAATAIVNGWMRPVDVMKITRYLPEGPQTVFRGGGDPSEVGHGKGGFSLAYTGMKCRYLRSKIDRRLAAPSLGCHKTTSAPEISNLVGPVASELTAESSSPETSEPLPTAESKMLRWLQDVGPCGTSCMACSVLHKITTKYLEKSDGHKMLDPSPIVKAGEEGWVEVDDQKGVSLLSLTNVAVRNTEDRTVWMQNAHLASGYMELVIIPAVDRFTFTQIVAKVTDNKHLEDPRVTTERVTSVVFEPTIKRDASHPDRRYAEFGIDGELIDSASPLRADLLPGALLLMAPAWAD
ncbi:protein kinase kinase kinase [Perkinsus olseni]|uniref:Protein kinase kinase kinase n=1 Tax=Perkinsus olseni TaxID=32597 RepID=A0A7J6NYC3_PEROL|nr:protein kinase kinase kinase [Perkinsus olseni]